MPGSIKSVLLAVVGLLIAGVGKPSFAQQPSIVGTWEWTRRKNDCSERQIFREDGTLSVKSGEEQTESTYLMSWAPEPSGRYKLTITTIRDDGGRDCDGATEDATGKRRVVYVLFSQSRDSMIQCASPEGTDCTGLMRRTAR